MIGNNNEGVRRPDIIKNTSTKTPRGFFRSITGYFVSREEPMVVAHPNEFTEHGETIRPRVASRETIDYWYGQINRIVAVEPNRQ